MSSFARHHPSETVGALDALWSAVLMCLLVTGFLAFLSANWAVVKGAPLAVVTLFIMAVAIAYGASSLLHSSKVGDLEQRIKLRDDQLEDLRAKVGTASADEIKARIDKLEAQVSDLVKETACGSSSPNFS